MTLKEKLCVPFGGLRHVTVKELEVIAEDFAIRFAEFCRDSASREGTYGGGGFTDNWELHSEQKIVTTKELLEIYKKEKGL